MPTLTIYTVSADIGLLNAILNGVAMICQQNSFIWGFAILASLWHILATVTKGTIESTKGGGVLAHGSLGAMMPLIFAMMLTSPGLQSKVQVQSTINGQVTAVDHVPFVIAVIPAAASLMSQEAGAMVETAFQGTGTDYPAISSSGNGFINPLKVLLTSRTAVLKLGGIDSQLNSVLSACLGSDAGVNYGAIHAKVMNAGNSGATSTESIQVADISGDAPTAIGALLYQASLNDTAFVPDIVLDGASFLSCADAANLVADNINTQLSSAEFTRVAQGAVNASDQPVPGADFSITKLARQYTALRTANTLTNTLVGGAIQANAELINLLFAQIVDNSLNCLKADNNNKVTCQAAVMQANEMEKTNIQAAAAAVPMLKYAGNFANYILALVIGLGPIIVMFMMFAGVDASKNMKVAVHIMLWPLLVMNVGAELVNGMIHNSTANFLTSITQGGYLSQAVAIEAYKEFSLQIGTASQIMASLPILMSMIFVLSGASSLGKVVQSLPPASDKTADLAAPTMMAGAPLLRQQSGTSFTPVATGAVVKATGAIDAVSGSASFGALTKEASASISAMQSQQSSVAAGAQLSSDLRKSDDSSNYKNWGITSATGKSIRNSIEKAKRESSSASTGENVAGTRSNTNNSNATVGVNAGVQLGTSGGVSLGKYLSLSGGASAGATTTNSAQDSLAKTTSATQQQQIDESKAIVKAISDEITNSTSNGRGHSETQNLQKMLTSAKSYQTSLTDTKSNSDTTSQTVRDSSSFVQATSKIGASEIAQQLATNPEYAQQQLLSGRVFDAIPALAAYKATATTDMNNGATEQLSNPQARDAVIRHRSAVMMAQDQSATPANRLAAVGYLTESAAAMTHMRFTPGDTSMKTNDIAKTVDQTNANPLNLESRLNPTPDSTPAAPKVPAKPPAASKRNGPPAKPAGKAVPSSVPTTIPDSSESPGKGVQAQVDAALVIANRADLGATGDGTVKRVANNVADNINDLKRPPGTPSNTSLGDLPTAAKDLEIAQRQTSKIPGPNTPLAPLPPTPTPEEKLQALVSRIPK